MPIHAPHSNVGTGPYYQVDQSSDIAEFRANERYYGGRPFIDRLLPVEEVDRFAVLNPEWVDAYGGGDELRGLIQISDVGDSAVLLLNPEIVADDGEWEAWDYAAWHPGVVRYRSFWEMMETMYRDAVTMTRE